jgi:hypothetical protein
MNKILTLKPYYRSDSPNAVWYDLYNKVVEQPTVILSQFGDLHYPSYPNRPPVFMCNKVYLISCDKNFVYRYMNKFCFPHANEIYLLSHPCEPEVLRREFYKIYLDQYFGRYKDRWASDLDNVIIVQREKILEEIKEMLHL